MVALESQACGTPVVCYSLGALPEVVRDKYTGIVVKELSPDRLAESVIQLVTNKKSHTLMKRNCYKWVKQFTWSKTADGFLRAYQDVISLW